MYIKTFMPHTDKLLNNYLNFLNIKYKENKKDFIDFKNYNNQF